MAFDGLFIHSLLQDLTPTLVDSRLSKIYQPFDQDLVLIFRKNRKNYQYFKYIIHFFFIFTRRLPLYIKKGIFQVKNPFKILEIRVIDRT